MSEDERSSLAEYEGMTWGEAYRLLEQVADGELAFSGMDGPLVVSSDGWGQGGKYFFFSAQMVPLPDGSVVAGARDLYFRDFYGNVYASFPSAAGRNRRDWRVGPSRGKQDA